MRTTSARPTRPSVSHVTQREGEGNRPHDHDFAPNAESVAEPRVDRDLAVDARSSTYGSHALPEARLSDVVYRQMINDASARTDSGGSTGEYIRCHGQAQLSGGCRGPKQPSIHRRIERPSRRSAPGMLAAGDRHEAQVLLKQGRDLVIHARHTSRPPLAPDLPSWSREWIHTLTLDSIPNGLREQPPARQASRSPRQSFRIVIRFPWPGASARPPWAGRCGQAGRPRPRARSARRRTGCPRTP
jgi:hypothetical protein